jgi:hypothetical protein
MRPSERRGAAELADRLRGPVLDRLDGRGHLGGAPGDARLVAIQLLLRVRAARCALGGLAAWRSPPSGEDAPTLRTPSDPVAILPPRRFRPGSALDPRVLDAVVLATADGAAERVLVPDRDRRPFLPADQTAPVFADSGFLLGEGVRVRTHLCGASSSIRAVPSPGAPGAAWA